MLEYTDNRKWVEDKVQKEIRARYPDAEIFIKEGVTYKIETRTLLHDDDPWDNLDIEEIAVDTGIEDFAENHDRYLYGTM